MPGVRQSRWLWLFVAFAMVQQAQLLLHLAVVPYAGTLAVVALLGYAASSDGFVPVASSAGFVPVATPAGFVPIATPGGATRLAGLGGLAALAVAAAVVDGRIGGDGWPVGFGSSSGLVAALAVAAAVTAMSVAVLARVPARLPRRRLLPAALVTAVAVGLTAAAATSPAQRYPVVVVAVLWLPLVALVMVAFAANAALASGRRLRAAGLGLLPVLVLALGALGAAAHSEILEPREHLVCGPTSGDRPVAVRFCSTLSSDVVVRTELHQISSDRAASVYLAPALRFDPSPDAGPATGWNVDPWQGGPDWSTLWPAIEAAALLVGLGVVVRAVFPL